MDLIPFYARLVATLHQCLDDIAPVLMDLLLRDLRHQVRKKDQVHIHSKLKNVRFIGKWALNRTIFRWLISHTVIHLMIIHCFSQYRYSSLCSPAAEMTKFGLCPKPETMKCITVSCSFFAASLLPDSARRKY